MNVDAAISRNSERGALSAICRDHTCMFLGASTVIIEDLIDPEALEALACSEGLSLALDLNTQKVQVSTDCLATVKHIQEPFRGQSMVVVEEIKMKLQMIPYSEVIHEKRDCNTEAHVLAKAATSVARGCHLWLTGTPDIICIPLTIEIE